MINNTLEPLPYPYNVHIQRAYGWFELRCFAEAKAELDCIPESFGGNPHVLAAKYNLLHAAGCYETCLEFADAILQLLPLQPDWWLAKASLLTILGRSEDAVNTLQSVLVDFDRDWRFYYALASFSARLSRFKDAEHFLAMALVLEEQTVRKLALIEPDLASFRDSIATKENKDQE